MKSWVVLLRAVNVGGTGKLPMATLRAMCENAGFDNVRTYIASGNVLVRGKSSEQQVRQAIEGLLEAYAGKPVGVLVRTGTQMAEVLRANPFPGSAPNRTVAIFLDRAPPGGTLAAVTGRNGEQIALGKREIYVHYGEGMAESKLKIPAARSGTARNMNTIARLVAMSVST